MNIGVLIVTVSIHGWKTRAKIEIQLNKLLSTQIMQMNIQNSY